jgi:hypothetical protein
LLAETASSLQVLDMPLVEIDDEDMRVLFNLVTRCHTLRICESMKIDQTLPFLKATVRPRLQGRLHCRYHCRYHCSFTICNKHRKYQGGLLAASYIGMYTVSKKGIMRMETTTGLYGMRNEIISLRLPCSK